MKTKSNVINIAIEKSICHQNGVATVEHGWSKMDEVIVMESPLIPILKNALLDLKGLKYSHYEGSPHNAGGDHFVDFENKIALSFPL